MSYLNIPVSAYRIQFSTRFTFKDCAELIPYLNHLGIHAIYASPVFASMPGSTHGYDSVNPTRINPEIGTEEDFEALINILHEHNMIWIQDIVPNHMAYHANNPLIFDVLEKGPKSLYADWFDIQWDHPDPFLDGKLMAPFLGSTGTDALRRGELMVRFVDGTFYIVYYDHFFPVNSESYKYLLRDEAGGNCPRELEEWIDGVLDNPGVNLDEARAKLDRIFQFYPPVQKFIEQRVNKINDCFDSLKQLMEYQYYILTHWRETEKRINYRRFFTINDLIGLEIHKEEVFDWYHQLIIEWLENGWIQGLRIDHVDGLADPGGYLERLKRVVPDSTYIIVEKILTPEEVQEPHWPVQGTTGYDFLGNVNQLLANRGAKNILAQVARGFDVPVDDYELFSHEKKDFVLQHRFYGEFKNLIVDLLRIELVKKSKLRRDHLMDAFHELLVNFNVYRFYKDEDGFTEQQKKAFIKLIKKCKKKRFDLRDEFALIEKLFLANKKQNEKEQQKIDDLFRKTMQLAGPLMAKGYEDTLFYTYPLMIAHNEVGDDPGHSGCSVNFFHRKMERRAFSQPHSFNATSSHDTKRGEDARARLLVLTDIPDEWKKTVEGWRSMNQDAKMRTEKGIAPLLKDEYLIYQSLVGFYPLGFENAADLRDRFKDFIIKAVREGKENSSWAEQQEDYEKAMLAFVDYLFDKPLFIDSLERFIRYIQPFAVLNSLNMVLLKIMAPGVPEFFRGCETWNLSLVDPDNRREVDFNDLQKKLGLLLQEQDAGNGAEMIQYLWQQVPDGRIKQWLIHRLLQERIEEKELLTNGHYLPIEVKGALADHVIAWARYDERQWIINVAALGLAGICHDGFKGFSEMEWLDTRLVLPDFSPVEWVDVLTDREINCHGELFMDRILDQFSLSVLKGKVRESNRKAGVLLHITSLNGPYGIGDMGPEAYKFVDFLKEAKQSCWQILPLTQTDDSFSPYSSPSAFAGNLLLISLDKLLKDGFLPDDYQLPSTIKTGRKVDFHAAKEIKNKVLQEAWDYFIDNKPRALMTSFDLFCEKEAYWLDDYVLFMSIKKKHGFPWSNWPVSLREREQKALDHFKSDHEDQLRKEKFFQFLFYEQWRQLKEYTNSKGIRIIGDIPVYVSYNSADVWAHPGLFRLNDQKEMEVVAGVPPDYFNENGQLWGMPLYDWANQKEGLFDWWVSRLKKNLILYDRLRIDHFRGFSAYWEVPGDEDTAINGAWREGPAYEFFDHLRKVFPDMPFIAEDLGDIDQPVYDLRDHYHLPGMRVLQFAFGEDMARSEYIPHHYVPNTFVYTGTHDNNTTKGWFKYELDKPGRHRLAAYLNKKVNKKNVVEEMIRLAYASVGEVVIIPMQDHLSAGPKARMNMPSSAKGNWQWKLSEGQLSEKVIKKLRKWVAIYHRF